VWSVDEGVITVPGDALCAEVEARVAPALFASDRPDLTVDAWIARGGVDLLWEILGATRSQVLGLTAELRSGARVTFGGRVVKNVAGYDLSRAFVGAQGALGRVLVAHLRVRPAPRGWHAAVCEGTPREEALSGPGAAVWTGDCWRFLRRGEAAPPGYRAIDPLKARALLREPWRRVRSIRDSGEGILVGGVVGSERPPDERRDPLWQRVAEALAT